MTGQKAKEIPLITLMLQNENDVMLARRRARQIAQLLGFGGQDQTRISTAISEVSRNAVVHAKGGKLSFLLDDKREPMSLVTTIIDRGDGIENHELALSGTLHKGLVGASRLMDKFEIESSNAGTSIRLQKNLAARDKFTSNELSEIANALTKVGSISPLDEIHTQNQELLAALEDSAKKQLLLDELNAKLQIMNDQLEIKVAERTAELLEANTFLTGARDEAVMANALKTQFVGSISHEIRTPMSGILGLAGILVSDPTMPEDLREMAECIVESAAGLMIIVNDLLDFSRLEAGQVKAENVSLSVNDLMNETAEAERKAAEAKGLSVKTHVNSKFPEAVFGDSTRIQKALRNLIQNAIKFTDKGQIEISAELQSINKELVVVRFCVSDTGIGISPETQLNLFQPFVQGDGTTTRKYGGTGLGLSIVKHLVELMLGSVGLESEEGKGSMFWFTIPLWLHEKG